MVMSAGERGCFCSRIIRIRTVRLWVSLTESFCDWLKFLKRSHFSWQEAPVVVNDVCDISNIWLRATQEARGWRRRTKVFLLHGEISDRKEQQWVGVEGRWEDCGSVEKSQLHSSVCLCVCSLCLLLVSLWHVRRFSLRWWRLFPGPKNGWDFEVFLSKIQTQAAFKARFI